MDEDITLEQIVAADDVLQRWHKSAAFLNNLAKTRTISLYVLNDSRVRPTDGKTVYFCSRVLSIYCYDYSNELYDTDNIFLRPEDVAAYEKAHPEILWEPAHPEDAIVVETGDTASGLPDVSASNAVLEAALAAKDAELEQARAEAAALREENAALKAALEQARQAQASPTLEGHGLCSRVITMRQEGKTEEEIAVMLHDSGEWCSLAQVGALLYQGDRVSKDAMLKHAQRILGKA